MTVSISMTKSEWTDAYNEFESPERDIAAFLMDWLKLSLPSLDIQGHDITYIGRLYNGHVFYGTYNPTDAMFVVNCFPEYIKIEVYPWSNKRSMDVDIKEDIVLTPS